MFRSSKVDAAKREIWGVVTAEVEDKDGETCHYDSTKSEYKGWSGEFLKATDGKSCGNLCEMHQLRDVGKGIDLAFNDSGKEIVTGFKVVDDDAWNKDIKCWIGAGSANDPNIKSSRTETELRSSAEMAGAR